MKKLLLFFTTVIISCCLAACSSGQVHQSSESTGSVISSDVQSASETASAASHLPEETSVSAAPTSEVTETDTVSVTKEDNTETANKENNTETTTEENNTEELSDGELTKETSEESAVTISADQLIILNSSDMYTYAEMVSDADLILQLFPDLVTMDSLAQTTDGREILHFVVGNPDAEKQIFINGAIHAREYLTAQLVMKQMVTYLMHVANGDTYGDISYRDMWNSVAIHVVPMINPDGVSISQLGLDGVQNQSTLDMLSQIAANDGSDLSASYLDRWKANALGVDLNRNFDAYWENYEGTGYPSADHYKGTAPGSEIESNAVIQLTLENNFLYTISYHTQGQLIYWCFDNMDSFYDVSAAWVSQLSAATGYALDSNYSAIDPAGYSDWGIYRCQIPSVTIEVASGESPYLQDQFDQVFRENINVWEITVLSALGY